MTESEKERFFGAWRTDPADSKSLSEYGDVSLEFGTDGILTYTIYVTNRMEIIIMTYRLEGNQLITNQASSPREERSEFSFTADGRLVIRHSDQGSTAFYVRSSSTAQDRQPRR